MDTVAVSQVLLAKEREILKLLYKFALLSTPISFFLFSPMKPFRFPAKKYYPESTTPSFNRSFIR
jgi:hypothetical protein